MTQAAATARNERYTLSEYLDRLNDLPLLTTIEKREGGSYPETVSTALWLACKTTTEIIKRKSPTQGRLAIQQLSALSLLAAPGVPIRWLEHNTDRESAKKALSALFLNMSDLDRQQKGTNSPTPGARLQRELLNQRGRERLRPHLDSLDSGEQMHAHSRQPL